VQQNSETDNPEVADRGTVRPEIEPAAESDAEAEAEKPSVLRTELPFGPFLAMAAVVYLFAEPWIEIHFHLPGG
jgi:hypothetical protein